MIVLQISPKIESWPQNCNGLYEILQLLQGSPFGQFSAENSQT